MCPKHQRVNLQKQQGSMLVVAIFILVVMGLLVAGLLSLLQKSTESVSVEVLGTRAFWAAQSGLELGAVALFPVAQNNFTPASCALVPTRQVMSAEGLVQCEVNIQCTEALNTDSAVTQFLLESEGLCQSETVQSRRSLVMELWQ